MGPTKEVNEDEYQHISVASTHVQGCLIHKLNLGGVT